jgi:hypothetical protein
MPLRFLLVLCAGLLLGACQPEDRRPGLWLSGEPMPYPEDWSFADQHQEIALEVGTPYLLPHSVTIWCATLRGDLYLGASRPEEKNWPGWVNEDPQVRLLIGDALYEARLEPLEDQSLIREVTAVQSKKYGFPMPEGPTGAWYWRVDPRRG